MKKNITTQNNMCMVSRKALLLDTRDFVFYDSITNSAEHKW